MNVLKIVMLVFCFFVCLEAKKKSEPENASLTLYGASNLQSQSLKSLTCNGAAHLTSCDIEELTARGSCNLSNSTVGNLSTAGSCNIGASKIQDKAEIRGAFTANNSTFSKALSIRGGTTLDQCELIGDVSVRGGLSATGSNFLGSLDARGGTSLTKCKISKTSSVSGALTTNEATFEDKLTAKGALDATQSTFTNILCGGEVELSSSTVSGSFEVTPDSNKNTWSLFGVNMNWLASQSQKTPEYKIKSSTIKGDLVVNSAENVKDVKISLIKSSIQGSLIARSGIKVILTQDQGSSVAAMEGAVVVTSSLAA